MGNKRLGQLEKAIQDFKSVKQFNLKNNGITEEGAEILEGLF